MILQLTSGIGGPPECAYAVGGVFRALSEEFPDIELADARPARGKGCYSSITFTCERDLWFLGGTILWVCESPFRPHHRRKNWYIGCAAIPEAETPHAAFDKRDVRMELFRSGGPGGQNVNKVETGVRLVHIPTGVAVTSTSERTQHANRRIAERRLDAGLAEREAQELIRLRNEAWREHGGFERGNPVRTYRGPDFRLDG